MLDIFSFRIKQMKHFYIIMTFLFCGLVLPKDAGARHFKDTINFRKVAATNKDIVMTDSALNALGIDSLLDKIEGVHATLTDIINNVGLGFNTRDIEDHYADVDSNIDLIEANLKAYNSILDVKNLQMFIVILGELKEQLVSWRNLLFSYDHELLAMAAQRTAIRNDSLLRQIMHDSVFTAEYTAEIQDIRDKRRLSKKLIAENQTRLKQLQVNVSNQYFECLDLEHKAKDMLRKAGLNVMEKEYDFLWQMRPVSEYAEDRMQDIVAGSYKGQARILSYYFKRNINDQLWMLACGFLFFFWILFNFRRLSREHDEKEIPTFRYIGKVPVMATLVALFSISPFFDIHPPTAYVQINMLVIVVTLTILLWRRWERKLFFFWLGIAVLFLCFAITGVVMVPTPWFRVLLVTLNAIAIIFGILWIWQLRRKIIPYNKLILWISVIFVLLNVAAIFCNFYGRVSLSKIFSVTAMYGLTHIIGLTVFMQIVLEAIHLQTAVNKLKGGLIGKLNFMKVEGVINTMLLLVAVTIWCIVFSISLNIYNYLYEFIFQFLTKTRRLGTTDFQIGNILLFLFIIYISNLFQQGVGSLYSKSDSSWDPEIKKNASRLAITRLLLIVCGFLLAVAASGLPMDKITIVLGALGVGIGLGLQTIVNNLVSGVILIFEQPFRIGDYIELGDKRGRVLDIGIRSSKIMMEEGAEIIMPNADLLSGRVINWTMRNEHARIEFVLNLDAGKNFKEVESLVSGEIKIFEHVIANMPPEILLLGITEKGMTIRILVWIDDVHITQRLKSKMLHHLSGFLNANGIKIV